VGRKLSTRLCYERETSRMFHTGTTYKMESAVCSRGDSGDRTRSAFARRAIYREKLYAPPSDSGRPGLAVSQLVMPSRAQSAAIEFRATREKQGTILFGELQSSPNPRVTIGPTSRGDEKDDKHHAPISRLLAQTRLGTEPRSKTTAAHIGHERRSDSASSSAGVYGLGVWRVACMFGSLPLEVL
jgi:hypothetical protein